MRYFIIPVVLLVGGCQQGTSISGPESSLSKYLAREQAEREARDAKEKSDRLSAMRAALAAAKSFDHFKTIWYEYHNESWKLGDVETEINDAQRAWYLGRYYVPKKILPVIEAHGFVLGMTTEQVLASRGFPDRVNRTVTSFGTHEQWVYTGDRYLYFENNVLTSWQD